MTTYRFSQLQAYLRCPTYYYYSWVEGFGRVYDGLPKPIGSALHKGVELLCGNVGRQDSILAAQELYWKELREPYEKMDQTGKNRVKGGWYQVEAMLKKYTIPRAEETIATEQTITIDMGHDRALQGTVDRIFKVNGLKWVLDTKTTGYDIAKVLKIHRLRKQFPGYVLLAQSQGHEIAGVYVDLVYKPRVYFNKKGGEYTGDHTVQDPLYHREPLSIGTEELDAFKMWFHRVANAIEEDLRDHNAEYESGAFPMNTDSCLAYNSVCPFFECCRNPKQYALPEALYTSGCVSC